jgi:hypothetical protein
MRQEWEEIWSRKSQILAADRFKGNRAEPKELIDASAWKQECENSKAVMRSLWCKKHAGGISSFLLFPCMHRQGTTTNNNNKHFD